MSRTRRPANAAARLTTAAVLLAGPPYLLARFIGWPLPTHPPTWVRLRVFLTGPLSDDAIIKVLAGVVWLLWAIFALSVIIEVAAAARGRTAPRLPVIAPIQAFAAALIGATVLTTAPVPAAVPRAFPLPHALATHAAAAPPRPGQADQSERRAAPAVVTAALDARPSGDGAVNERVTPRPRIHRVIKGDNLWDIAARFLGSGECWREIYDLNAGKPQPDGLTLTDPGLIYPGWVLLLPAVPDRQGGTTSGGHPQPSRPSARPQPGRRTPRPAAPSPSSVAPRSPQVPHGTPANGQSGAHGHAPSAGVRLPSGALIGLGTAVAVSAALALARIHRRRRYRPGATVTSSLEPSEPLPPLITALDRAGRPRSPDRDTGSEADLEDADADLDLYELPGPLNPAPAPADPRADPELAVPGPAPGQARAGDGLPSAPQAVPPGQIPIGVRGGQEIIADVAALGGLGLTGPGASSAARAIVAGLLSQRAPGGEETPARIIIPAEDARLLLPSPGRDEAHLPVPGLSVPPTLTAALDEIEALLVRRARMADIEHDEGEPPHAVTPLGAAAVLIATSDQAAAHRLRGVFRAGRDLGVMAIMLGTWPDGATCEVAADGMITSGRPPDAGLDGIEAYHLAVGDITAITGLMREARDIPDDTINPSPAPGDGGMPSFLRTPPAAPATADAPATDASFPSAPAARPSGHEQPQAEAQASAPESPTYSSAAKRPVEVSVLGPLRITAKGREIDTGMRKARELLAFLAVAGADGATAEAISEALWPGSPPSHGTSQRNIALRKARELLRRATGLNTPMWINLSADRYRLDPALIDVDLWKFQAALEAARTAPDDQARLAACQQAASYYRGQLADGAGYEWAEPYAETARRRALDVYARIAEILKPTDPEQALAVLETALTHDPYNEYTYQQIMRLQAEAGRPDAVRRTLQLLETRLGELGVTPGASTRHLAATLLGTAEPQPRLASPACRAAARRRPA